MGNRDRCKKSKTLAENEQYSCCNQARIKANAKVIDDC